MPKSCLVTHFKRLLLAFFVLIFFLNHNKIKLLLVCITHELLYNPHREERFYFIE